MVIADQRERLAVVVRDGGYPLLCPGVPTGIRAGAQLRRPGGAQQVNLHTDPDDSLHSLELAQQVYLHTDPDDSLHSLELSRALIDGCMDLHGIHFRAAVSAGERSVCGGPPTSWGKPPASHARHVWPPVTH